MGEGERGGLTGGESGRERERREAGCSHLELLHGTFVVGGSDRLVASYIRRWRLATQPTSHMLFLHGGNVRLAVLALELTLHSSLYLKAEIKRFTHNV